MGNPFYWFRWHYSSLTIMPHLHTNNLPIPTAVDISPNAGQRIPLSYDDDDDRFGDMHVT